MQNIPEACAQSSAISVCQENEVLQTLYPDMGTEIISPNGVALRFDAEGRITSIGNSADATRKSFKYSAAGAIVEIDLHGHRLRMAESGWTDGQQLFDIVVSVDNIGTVTIIERNCAAITRLDGDGSAVTVYLSEQGMQSTVHRSFRSSSH